MLRPPCNKKYVSEVVTQEILSESLLYGHVHYYDCVFKNINSSEHVFHGWMFQHCIFMDCSFRASELRGILFDGCWFMHSVFDEAYIQGSCFRTCNIDTCGFLRTTIKRSIFDNCTITNTSLACVNECEGVDLYVSLACPSEGAFIGWKQAELRRQFGGVDVSNELILVKLLIPEDAKRSSATSNKCRCDKAKVLGFYKMSGDEIKYLGPECRVISIYDEDFEYHVGETVTPICVFDDNRWEECASGIHFFVDREAAIRY